MRIFPLGDSAATIEFGNEISTELNGRTIALAKHLSTHPFDGMIEVAPAYASVTVYYDPAVTTYAGVNEILAASVDSANTVPDEKSDLIEIPTAISSETSPDLSRIAKHGGLSEDGALEIFLSRTYRVYMLGFLPGFAYMGEVDERIETPRLDVPRTSVPKGSIGIACKQTGIYPLESPGGWNIIGRTDVQMFDPRSDEPCILKPGDEVRFVRC